MSVIWTGHKAKPWNPEALRVERELWERKHLPALRQRQREAEDRRRAAKAVFHQLTPEQQSVLQPFLGSLL